MTLYDPNAPDSLYALDKTEMRDVAKEIKPEITDAEFELLWTDFWVRKEEHLRMKALN